MIMEVVVVTMAVIEASVMSVVEVVVLVKAAAKIHILHMQKYRFYTCRNMNFNKLIRETQSKHAK